MGNAIKIKKWCEKELSPMAWPLVAMRALPEIMAEGMDVSLINIDDGTEFEPAVVKVINKCIVEAYQVNIPVEVLNLKSGIDESGEEKISSIEENQTSLKERIMMAFKILFNRK